MPYRLNPTDPLCVQVQRQRAWQRVKCHPTKRGARDHLTALRINVVEGIYEGSVHEADNRKARALGRSVNDRLMDANLRHRHLLLMIENGVAAEVVKAYEEALVSIHAHLAKQATRSGALTDLSRLSSRRLEILYARIEEALQIGDAAARGAVIKGLAEIIPAEVDFQLGLMRRTIARGVTLDLVGPDEALLRQILEEPLGGKTYGARFAKNHQATLDAMRGSLAQSVALGEGIDGAARRLNQNVTTLSRHRAVTITRSEIQRAANRAAQETYAANSGPSGVVKAIQVIETLDGTTCLICIMQDGKTFPPGSQTGSLPPYHANCRGFITPVLRSWEELGIDRKELSAGSRATMNGEVPQPVTYPEWFRTQPAAFQQEVLGPSRYRLYRKGKIDFDAMVKNNRIVPVSALPSFN